MPGSSSEKTTPTMEATAATTPFKVTVSTVSSSLSSLLTRLSAIDECLVTRWTCSNLKLIYFKFWSRALKFWCLHIMGLCSVHNPPLLFHILCDFSLHFTLNIIHMFEVEVSRHMHTPTPLHIIRWITVQCKFSHILHTCTHSPSVCPNSNPVCFLPCII